MRFQLLKESNSGSLWLSFLLVCFTYRTPGEEGVSGRVLGDICCCSVIGAGRVGKRLIVASLRLNREFMQHK